MLKGRDPQRDLEAAWGEAPACAVAVRSSFCYFPSRSWGGSAPNTGVREQGRALADSKPERGPGSLDSQSLIWEGDVRYQQTGFGAVF